MSFQLILSFVLALIPALIWAGIMFGDYRNKKVAVLMFLGGIFAVLLMVIIQVLGEVIANNEIVDYLSGLVSDKSILAVIDSFWDIVQDYNPVALMKNAAVGMLVVFVIAGAMEEVCKQWFVRMADDRMLLIKDVGTSIRYSLIAALGFAFAENIYYFYTIWTRLGAGSLMGPVIFRTTVTTAAHMCFSGIWGYYYGRGKFCVSIVEQKKWRKQKMFLTRLIAWFMNMPITQAFREKMIYKGLFVAMVFHASFNYLLEFEHILFALFSIVVAFALLLFLLKQKSENLMLVNDVDSRQISTMARKDEETVIEYIGILYNQGQYDQVIETCERLLEKDPDNNVVKLFQAKAFDKKKLQGYVRKLIQKRDDALSP